MTGINDLLIGLRNQEYMCQRIEPMIVDQLVPVLIKQRAFEFANKFLNKIKESVTEEGSVYLIEVHFDGSINCTKSTDEEIIVDQDMIKLLQSM